jgi:hypothetical protein
MIFDDTVDESEVKPNLAGLNGPSSWQQRLADVRTPIPATSQEADNNAAAMTVRIVRNFASWISAFPVRPSPDRRGTIGSGEVGGSVAIGPMVYLKTEVQMAPEMRAAAKALVRMDADYAVRKMAMRHIVRGHWKRQVTKMVARLFGWPPIGEDQTAQLHGDASTKCVSRRRCHED